MPARLYWLAAPLLLGSAMAGPAAHLSSTRDPRQGCHRVHGRNVRDQGRHVGGAGDVLARRGAHPPQGPSCGATLAPRQSCSISTRGTSLYGFCQATGSGKLRLSVFGYIGNDVVVALPGTAN